MAGAIGTGVVGVGDAIWITLHPAIRTVRIAATTAIIQRLMVTSSLLSNGVNGLEFSRVSESCPERSEEAAKGRLEWHGVWKLYVNL
jgi:hypothetical protein